MRIVLFLLIVRNALAFSIASKLHSPTISIRSSQLFGWIQRSDDGSWVWEEDDPNYVPPPQQPVILAQVGATPKLPSGSYRPKQSLGQNYLRDGNTVAKLLRAFHADATQHGGAIQAIVELGPGAGALTDKLVETYTADALQCIEIDQRSVDILKEKHPGLRIRHDDVMQVDYPAMAEAEGHPLAVIGNLPYYITSQILFALADASHSGAIYSATVTMQWEVAQRMVASTSTKDYGILSVVFQLYADTKLHFKIPPTVFYPKPKVDSALIGLHFLGPDALRRRLCGVQPVHIRRILNQSFQQRRKTVRNSLKQLVVRDLCYGDAEKAAAVFARKPLPLPATVQAAVAAGDKFAMQQALPDDWASKRPEQLSPGQFVELARLLFGSASTTDENGNKVWRKLKHGSNLKP
jgi:16S rRNA (adenine1518-N6/adenine1519-N6)-dimethyltransferase